jgi:hypothetical protein
MYKLLIACLLSQIAFAVHAEDHLVPLDGNGVYMASEYGQFVESVSPKNYDEISSIYIFPSFKPSSYIAILQNKGDDSYYLLYAQHTKPTPSIVQIVLPTQFSKAFSGKLMEIIQRDTRFYENPLIPIECTDGTAFIFESNSYYGRSNCRDKDSVPYQLVLVAERLIALTQSPAGNPDKLQQQMKDILTMLDAIKLPPVHDQ